MTVSLDSGALAMPGGDIPAVLSVSELAAMLKDTGSGHAVTLTLPAESTEMIGIAVVAVPAAGGWSLTALPVLIGAGLWRGFSHRLN